MKQNEIDEINKVLREAKALETMHANRFPSYEEWQARNGRRMKRGAMTGTDGQKVSVADALLDPARFTALCVGGMLTNPDAMLDSGALVSGIKMLAAQLKAGNMDYVYEALVGNAITLQALEGIALEAAADCANPKDKALLLGLAIKANTSRAKVICSLPAIEKASNTVGGGLEP